MVVARAAGVHEVVDAVLLQHERRLKEVFHLGVRDEFLVGERFHVVAQSGHATAEPFVDAPRAEIDVDRAVVVDEGLPVEGDGVVDKAVGHEHGVGLSEDVLPRPAGSLADAFVQHARLAVEVVVLSVAAFHHVGRPDHLGGGPVHGHVSPVLEVLRHPDLCRTVAVAVAVGGGI